MRAILAALVLLALGGCAPRVDFASPASITIRYDPGITNLGKVQQIAQAHCIKHGKNAVPEHTQPATYGDASTSFVCR
jgi:hypothetical protein